MSTSLIWVVTACYLGTAAHQAWLGNWAWATVWFSYGTANFGLIAAMK
jgi:hypothetical protein